MSEFRATAPSATPSPGAIESGSVSGVRRTVGAGLEEALGRLGPDGDPLEPLHAPGADVTGDHEPQRSSVDGGKRPAVHVPGEQDLLGRGLVERDRGSEGLRRVGLIGDVGAEEGDVLGVLSQAGRFEHVGQPRAAPDRVPGGPRPPRRLPGDVADLEEPNAAVAGALQRGGHLVLDEALLELIEHELELILDQAVHARRRHDAGSISGTGPWLRT